MIAVRFRAKGVNGRMQDPADEDHTLNVQAVAKRTGVSSETLRTWERRYGWPKPIRLANGYRAYSENDVLVILEVKREMDTGVAAATAWQRVLTARTRRHANHTSSPPEQICTDLISALLGFDGESAQQTLIKAHTIYPLERIVTDVLQPVLVHIGTLWHEGEATVAQEHFASNLLRDHLVSLGNAYRPKTGSPRVLLGAAPEELHEIGLLMLSTLLKRDRYTVLYLGQNNAIDHLTEDLKQIRPQLLVLSASRLETAQHLLQVPAKILQLPPPRPIFAFGGRGFDDHQELVAQIQGVFLSGDLIEVATQIEMLL